MKHEPRIEFGLEPVEMRLSVGVQAGGRGYLIVWWTEAV